LGGVGLLIPATLTTLVSCGNKDETKDEIYIKATKSTIDQSGDEADIGIFNKDGKQYHLTDLRDPVE
jgi:major membrane immunogen (membrane-anchored lipoprotein)